MESNKNDTILGIVLFLPALIVSGAVISTLWGWFLVPLGLPSIGIVQALGIKLALFVIVPTTINEDKSLSEQTIFSIVLNLASLGLGYIYMLVG